MLVKGGPDIIYDGVNINQNKPRGYLFFTGVTFSEYCYPKLQFYDACLAQWLLNKLYNDLMLRHQALAATMLTNAEQYIQ